MGWHEKATASSSKTKLHDAADLLDAAAPDVLAYTAFPRDTWRKIWSNNPQGGSTKRSAAEPTWSGSSPTRDAVIRLVGAVLAEQHDEWAVARRYISHDALRASTLTVIDGDRKEDTTAELLSAAV